MHLCTVERSCLKIEALLLGDHLVILTTFLVVYVLILFGEN